jgi:hypothetical protein
MCFLNDKTKSVEAREVCQKDFGYAQENKVVKDAQGRTKKYVCCKEEMPTKGMGGQENCPDGQFVECTYQGKGGCRNFPSKNKVCERSIKLNKLNKHETCICGLTLCNAEHYECNPTANDGLGMCDDDDESDDEEEE